MCKKKGKFIDFEKLGYRNLLYLSEKKINNNNNI
jgi:hypothetical protein